MPAKRDGKASVELDLTEDQLSYLSFQAIMGDRTGQQLAEDVLNACLDLAERRMIESGEITREELDAQYEAYRRQEELTGVGDSRVNDFASSIVGRAILRCREEGIELLDLLDD